MNILLKRCISLVLVLLTALTFSAVAFGAEAAEDGAAEEMSIIDEAALTAAVEELLAAYGISGERLNHISFAYTYLATGDTWYYNPDTWYYPASMYKVPMMMVLAEREYEGELSPDSDINGISLADAEEIILVHSNNDYAHVVRNYLGGDAAARPLYKKYSSLDDSYYHSDFVDYCYFTVRYMDDVMQTLYNEPERFPNITECLLRAMPYDFFHLRLDPSIPIAQKYGAYLEFHSTTGIIYSENPFILTVMSDCLSYEKAEALAGDAAMHFYNYTLGLDEKLALYEQELAEAERLAAEEKRRAEEEAARLAAEEAERKRLEEEARIAEEKRIAEEAAAAARKEKLIKYAMLGAAVLAVAALIIGLIRSNLSRRRRERELAWRREEERRRRYDLSQQQSHASFHSRDDYRGRH